MSYVVKISDTGITYHNESNNTLVNLADLESSVKRSLILIAVFFNTLIISLIGGLLFPYIFILSVILTALLFICFFKMRIHIKYVIDVKDRHSIDYTYKMLSTICNSTHLWRVVDSQPIKEPKKLEVQPTVFVESLVRQRKESLIHSKQFSKQITLKQLLNPAIKRLLSFLMQFGLSKD